MVVTPLTDPQPDIKLCPECGAAMQIKKNHPEPEIQVNRFTKKEYAKLSVDEFDKIKQVIEHQQTQITSLEAQKSDLSAKLENVESKLDIARKKPYMRENERLSAELEKNKSKIDKFDEISVQNQQLKEQINTLSCHKLPSFNFLCNSSIS